MCEGGARLQGEAALRHGRPFSLGLGERWLRLGGLPLPTLNRVSPPAFDRWRCSMATKADFTVEEWGRILASPMVAGMAITAADPSGVWGLLKEGMAGGWALLEARQNAQANSLVRAVAEDFATGDGRTAARVALQARFTGAKVGGLKEACIAELRAVAGILDGKADKAPVPSRRGCAMSRKRLRKPERRAASWASEGSR